MSELTQPIIHTYDSEVDVLYIRYEGVKIAYSEEAPHDKHLIINFDYIRNVVGLQLLFVRNHLDWANHPDKALIPEDLAKVVEEWTTPHSLMEPETAQQRYGRLASTPKGRDELAIEMVPSGQTAEGLALTVLKSLDLPQWEGHNVVYVRFTDKQLVQALACTSGFPIGPQDTVPPKPHDSQVALHVPVVDTVLASQPTETRNLLEGMSSDVKSVVGIVVEPTNQS